MAPQIEARVVAAVIGVAGFAALGAGVAFHVANQGSPVNAGVNDWWLMPLVSGLSFCATGVWLVRARPRLSIGWLSLAIGVVNAVMLVGVEYGIWGLARPGGAPLGTAALWLGNWTWVTALMLIATVLPLLLPDGRLVSRRWRGALALSIAAVAGQSVSWALTPYEAWSPALAAAGAVNPTGVGWVWDTVAVQVLLVVVSVAAVAVAAASLVVRWRRADGVLRAQLKWMALGLLLTFALWGAGFAAGPVATAAAMVPLPAACLVAVLRHRLWDVDLVVSRSLLYAALAGAVVIVYVACVGLLGGLLGRTTGAPLVATAVIAVCAEPAHRRLRTWVNRLVYGAPDDPFAVLARVGTRLQSARDGATVADEVLPEVVSAVAAAMRLPYVAIVLADGAVIEAVIEHGAQAKKSAETPLTYGGQQVGRLLYTPRPDGLGRVERRLLDDLARHAAVAAHTVVLARDLARSREQLVAAREEERRRLYRELHDGLGPSLASLALQVETARDLTSAEPDAARALLDKATPRLRSTVEEVRALVRGLRPAALDDLGLAGALRELGDSFASPGFAVSVDVAELAELPAAVEVAAYRIAAEALANAARHSGAASASVRVARAAGMLRLTVDDDGKGCADDHAGSGLGVASMRERAGELGGLFSLGHGTAGRGTRVEAVLPVAGLPVAGFPATGS
ncbi:hypothetical protein J5X84_01580 [Streptosporangiaceae bacterium NEAU-GS5]|nr:hypothetical protein [Streptosporangiaceae bacterium NEAU-GS5]